MPQSVGLEVDLHMLDRRRAGIAALAAASVALIAPIAALAQAKAPVKVRYNEVVRSILYAPAYVALAKGYFKDAGLDVEMSTANGGDKSMAALLGGGADIALMGPEVPIYVLNSESPTKVRIFSGLTATDGFMLVGREKIDKFEWSMLKGKEILGFRPGSTPLLYLEAAMRKNGVDPLKDVKLANNVAVPARPAPGSPVRTSSRSLSSPTPPNSCSMERRISRLRLAKRSEWPTTRRSWRPTST